MHAIIPLLLCPLLASAKSNLIFLLSDDLAQGNIGAYSQNLIQKATLDFILIYEPCFRKAFAYLSVS